MLAVFEAAVALYGVETGNWCNILIWPHFSVHKRGVHKWNTNLCIPLGCAVHDMVMLCTTELVYRNGLSVYICIWYHSGLLCKPEFELDRLLWTFCFWIWKFFLEIMDQPLCEPQSLILIFLPFGHLRFFDSRSVETNYFWWFRSVCK